MVNMTYTVTTVIPIDSEELGKSLVRQLVLPTRNIQTLAEAKKVADERIENFGTPGTVVELRERNGRAKYRAETAIVLKSQFESHKPPHFSD